MLIFGGPFLIGILGALNRQKKERITQLEAKRTYTALTFSLVVATVAFLDLISIILQAPVNGQGFSIYVPIYAALLSLCSIWALASNLVSVDEARRALELLILALYLLILCNCYLKFANWTPQLEVFQNTKGEDFRFSPFSELLQVEGRQAFFETDPENFGVYSMIALCVIIYSRLRSIQLLGSLLIFLLGSTSMSRLFYLGAVTLIFVFGAQKFLAKPFLVYFQRIFLLSIFLAYFFLLVIRDNTISYSAIGSISGRTRIWNVVLSHWGDRGKLFGNQGVYTLRDYSSENSGPLIFFHAHNLFADYLWDWGILGVLLVIILCLSFYSIVGRIQPAGFLLFSAILFSGLIEPTFSSNLLISKYIFVLIAVKYVSSTDWIHPKSEENKHLNT
jgi:hypothetical protein